MTKETKGAPLPASSNKANEPKDHKRGYAWLFVFIPAFVYYVHRVYLTSRATGSRNQYHPVAYYVQKENNGDDELRKILYLETKPLESNPNRLIFQTPMEAILRNEGVGVDADKGLFLSLMGPSWIHSPELGRGYLLFSDSHPSKNRVWRWEVGNGPITIGRTLHMAKSGCRSSQCIRHKVVDGGDSDNSDNSSESSGSEEGDGSADLMPLGGEGVEPLLVVCELGERRVVRIEEDGARTPLLTHYKEKGMNGPRSLTMSPFGDLIVTDPPSNGIGGGVYVVREIHDVEAIKSAESRMKHHYPANTTVELLYDGLYQPTGIAMGKDLDGVYISDGNAGNSIIVKVPFDQDEEEDDDDDDDDVDVKESKKSDIRKTDSIPKTREALQKPSSSLEDQCDALNQRHTFFSAIHHPTKIKFGGMVVDEHGNIWIAAGPSGVFIVSPLGTLLGSIPIMTESDFATDVTIGQDGYLYVTTHSQLLRLKVKVKQFMVPNIVSHTKRKK